MAAMEFGLLSAHNTLAALADGDDEIAEEELPQVGEATRPEVDILLNVAGEERRRQQKEHAVELADKSRWLEAPAGSDSV